MDWFPRLIWVAVFLFFFCLIGSARSVEPIIWREDTQNAFLRGEPAGVSITWDGVVALAPKFEKIADTGEQFVWALVGSPKERLYIGTGNRGRVFMLLGEKNPELVLDSPEVAIFSLTVDEKGVLYAGSSPDGLIYRIAPGKDPVKFCRTGDHHVWALTPDGKGGLYAATGGTYGRILQISSEGKVKEVYKTADRNFVSLVRDQDGNIFFGTDQNGLVYRLDGFGKVNVLYDASQEEIRALAVGSGGILYVGAMSGGSMPDQGNPSTSSRREKKEGKSVLYAVRASGAAYSIWETDEPLILALSLDLNGEITVVTGDQGHIYRVKSDGSATLLTMMDDVQPWAFAPVVGGEILIGTSGSGEVYSLGKTYSQVGTLTSKPYDFTLVSKWGRLDWKVDQPEGTSVFFQTRSGNSEEPDDTWSAWSDSLVQASQISSPSARFLQYRTHLTSEFGTATPRLREVSLAGLQENIRPVILDLSVSPLQGQAKKSSNGLGKNGGKGKNADSNGGKGIWEVSWSARDVNNDKLSYSLYFRGSNEKTWKVLEEDLISTPYRWNTESAPDGTMQVRLIASDRLSNPSFQALSTEKVSGPFDIDNTAPSVRLIAVKQVGIGIVSLEGLIEDATTEVRRAAYALNSRSWQILFPVDQIFDSRIETLHFKIDKLLLGEYTLVLRAADALGNIGVDKVVFQIK